MVLNSLTNDYLVIPKGKWFQFISCRLSSTLFASIVAERTAIITLQEVEEKYPGLVAVKKAVEEHPKIAAYLEKRPKTTF